MLGLREDVELLSPIGGVAVADDAELLEDVEGPIHGRRDRVGVERTTTVDELGTCHVAIHLRQDLDKDAPLRRPAQPPGA
jgi:hypothetical protein